MGTADRISALQGSVLAVATRLYGYPNGDRLLCDGFYRRRFSEGGWRESQSRDRAAQPCGGREQHHHLPIPHQAAQWTSIPYHSPQNKAKMLNALQPPKDLYRTLRETLFVRFVLAVLTPFTFLLGTLLRSHYRKVNGDRTPGLTRYRQ
ncbi:hypothetical protein KRP22_012655 [Phytophthora ramorum]|nr:hypothetical protein KRP22_12947 [Phytophthora ramorum]